MSLRIGDRERAEAYGTIGLTKPGRREAGAMPVSQGTAATDGARRSDEERLTETYFVRGYTMVRPSQKTTDS